MTVKANEDNDKKYFNGDLELFEESKKKRKKNKDENDEERLEYFTE